MTLTQDQHNNVTLTKTERMYDLSVSVEWKVVCCICRSVHLKKKKSSRSEKRKTKNGVKCMFSRPADVQIILRVLRREFAESLDD